MPRRRPVTARAGADRSGRADDLPLGSLAYARDILDSEELVQAGRSAQPRDRGTAMLSRLGIRQKLALLLAIPLVAIVVVMAAFTAERIDDARAAQATARTALAAREIGGLIQSLQQERSARHRLPGLARPGAGGPGRPERDGPGHRRPARPSTPSPET